MRIPRWAKRKDRNADLVDIGEFGPRGRYIKGLSADLITEGLAWMSHGDPVDDDSVTVRVSIGRCTRQRPGETPAQAMNRLTGL
jgi:hypothetical protein